MTKSLSFAEAAAAPLVLITGWESLYDRAQLKTGQTVLIHGGAGGDLVTIIEPNPNLGNLKKARQRNLSISLELMLTPVLGKLLSAQIHQTNILKQCATWIDEGKLTIHLSQTFPLSEVATAHRQIETGSTTGKIALIIS